MADERRKISVDEFKSLLDVKGGRVHTFRNPGANLLLGADWDLEDAIAAAEKHGAELAGEGATAMRHGAVVIDDRGPVFFATKEAEAPNG